MNCGLLSELTGWECTPAGDNSVRATAPFTLGNDGQHAVFYLAQPDEASFYITDAGETLMQAISAGVLVSDKKLETLSNSYGVRHAHFDRDGSITSEGHISQASQALWDSAKLAMSLSFATPRWLAKFDQIRFKALVEKLLVENIAKERFIKNYSVAGVSGHEVEFPFAIKMPDNRMTLIETVALNNEKVDWSNVYKLHGKLSDVKQADDYNQRLVIFEDNAPKLDYGRATTLLSQTARIITYSSAHEWAKAA